MLSLGGGQSIEDKLQAVKYFISGQGLSFVVLKATTSEHLGPKKKHLNYLVSITNEPNVSIPSLVKYLMQRARQPEWCVAFKSVITIHHLMSYASERFIQNLASSTVNHRYFDHLASFVDRTTSLSFNMSTFLRRYSRYLSTRIHAYRSLGLDFCKMQTLNTKSKESPFKLRTLSSEQLVKFLPILQGQFDALLAFDASSKDLNNGIINTAFAMLYKDFVKLYIFYQTAIIRLLELYFDNNQLKRAQELLEAYKKFLVRMDKVSDFIRVIDSVGMDKSDMPNVSRAPSLSLKLLEEHLKQLERANKKNQQAPMVKVQSIDLPRIGYATLQGRRKTLRSLSSKLSCSMETNDKSPKLLASQKRPVESLSSEQSSKKDDCLADKKKKDCDTKEKILNSNSNEANCKSTPFVPRYDLLSGAFDSNFDDLIGRTSIFDEPPAEEQQEDLIIMTEPGEQVQDANTATTPNGGSNDTQARCQTASPMKPIGWVQVDL